MAKKKTRLHCTNQMMNRVSTSSCLSSLIQPDYNTWTRGATEASTVPCLTTSTPTLFTVHHKVCAVCTPRTTADSIACRLIVQSFPRSNITLSPWLLRAVQSTLPLPSCKLALGEQKRKATFQSNFRADLGLSVSCLEWRNSGLTLTLLNLLYQEIEPLWKGSTDTSPNPRLCSPTEHSTATKPISRTLDERNRSIFLCTVRNQADQVH